jgi:predicted enzyme related to lactoylglutathione lyase
MADTARILSFALETGRPEDLAEFYGGVFGWRLLADGSGFTLDDSLVSSCLRGDSPGWLPVIDGRGMTGSKLDSLGFAWAPTEGSELAVIDTAGVRTRFESDPSSRRFVRYDPLGARDGQPSWLQLNTSHADTALPLYCMLLGWQAGESDNDKYTYSRFIYDGMARAGAMVIDGRSGESIEDGWQVYFHWGGLDGVADRVLSNGGTVVVPPTRLVAGQFLVAADPEGNIFGVDDMLHRPLGVEDRLP